MFNGDLNEKIKKLIIILLCILISIFTIILFLKVKNYIFFTIGFLINLFIPILLGFLIAYLMWPLVKMIDKIFKKRFISIVISFLIIIIFISYIFIIFLPNVYKFILLMYNYDYSNNNLYIYLNQLPAIHSIFNFGKSNLVIYFKNLFINNLNISEIISIVFDSIGSIISISTSFILSIVISIYILLRYKFFTSKIKYIFPPKKRKNSMNLIYEINNVIRNYLSGLVLIGLINASIIFIVYNIIGFGFNLSLNFALLLFLLYSVPFIGTFISGIPAAIYGFQISTFHGILVIISLIILQSVTSHVFEPNIYGSKMGIDPLSIIIGVIIISSLFGFIGLILTMPLVGVASVLIRKIAETYKFWFSEIK